MLLPDVNVLIYAHREESPDHAAYLGWLTDTLNRGTAFALSELVISGFLRIVTNPRVFTEPTPTDEGIAFIDAIAERPHCRLLRPGPRNLSIFYELCRASGARASLIADAYHAALAVEHGCTFVTTDNDFASFPGLTWVHPLRGGATRVEPVG